MIDTLLYTSDMWTVKTHSFQKHKSAKLEGNTVCLNIDSWKNTKAKKKSFLFPVTLP